MRHHRDRLYDLWVCSAGMLQLIDDIAIKLHKQIPKNELNKEIPRCGVM